MFSTRKPKSEFSQNLLTQAGIDEKIALTQKFTERKKAEYEILQAELKMMKEVCSG